MQLRLAPYRSYLLSVSRFCCIQLFCELTAKSWLDCKATQADLRNHRRHFFVWRGPCVTEAEYPRCLGSAPANPIWRGGPPLLPSPAAPLPFLSCPLSYFNSRHKTLHFGANFMKIGPKLKKVINVWMSFLSVLYFWGIYCGMGLYFVTCLDTKHITCHMVPKFLYDRAKSALPGTPLPSNPSWSTAVGIPFAGLHVVYLY